MTHTQHALNIQQYQDKSHNYLNSAVHAQGAEFDKIKQLIEAHKHRHILDLGCGGGHVSYQVMHTADTSIQVIRALQKNCAASVRQYFDIDEAGNFNTDVIYLVLSK